MTLFGTKIVVALLVFVTQNLALRAIPAKAQTVTASPDEYRAWSGVGSALVTTWDQVHLPSSVVGAISVALYLVCVSILHISTSSMFNLEVVDLPNQQTISTTVGLPIFPEN